MTIRYALVTIMSCVLTMALVGAVVGFSLGRFVPNYYRTVFRNSRHLQIDPVSMGIGQGLSQGTAGGAIVGLVLVAILCWRETRLHGRNISDPTTHTSEWFAKKFLLGFCLLLAIGFGLCIGGVLGLLTGEYGAYQRLYLEQYDIVAPTLASDPAFAKVEVLERSDGGIWLLGEVPTSADRERVTNVVIRAIGEKRAKEAMGGVKVK